MYRLLITITNPNVEGPITVSVFGHPVNFEYTARGRVRKLTGVIETPSSISKDGIAKVKELLSEHGSSVEVIYKEDPVIAKAAKNIERMLSGIGTKMNKKTMRSMKSAAKSASTAKTRKQVAKAVRSLARMPEAEMTAAVAALPKSIQQHVMSKSARRGRTFSSRSMRNGSSRTMRRASEKKYAQIMKKRLAFLASIAEGNEKNRS
jgi:flagellum-specific peptidoglycan hydrolase FlgJ